MGNSISIMGSRGRSSGQDLILEGQAPGCLTRFIDAPGDASDELVAAAIKVRDFYQSGRADPAAQRLVSDWEGAKLVFYRVPPARSGRQPPARPQIEAIFAVDRNRTVQLSSRYRRAAQWLLNRVYQRIPDFFRAGATTQTVRPGADLGEDADFGDRLNRTQRRNIAPILDDDDGSAEAARVSFQIEAMRRSRLPREHTDTLEAMRQVHSQVQMGGALTPVDIEECSSAIYIGVFRLALANHLPSMLAQPREARAGGCTLGFFITNRGDQQIQVLQQIRIDAESLIAGDRTRLPLLIETLHRALTDTVIWDHARGEGSQTAQAEGWDIRSANLPRWIIGKLDVFMRLSQNVATVADSSRERQAVDATRMLQEVLSSAR